MTKTIEEYTTKRIQADPHYYFTVEDYNVGTGLGGITISYKETVSVTADADLTIPSAEEGLAVGKAIVELCEAMIAKDKSKY